MTLFFKKKRNKAKIKTLGASTKTYLHNCYSPFSISVIPIQPTTTEAKTDLPEVLSMDTVGQLDIFRHYGNTLSMYSTQVGILKEAS